nr:Uncharacterised protein [Salmonella sp. NCTC 7297]
MLFYRGIIISNELCESLLHQLFNACALSQPGMVFTANQNALYHIKGVQTMERLLMGDIENTISALR